MADVATTSAAIGDSSATDKSKKIEKPEKPDEETYKAELKKLEKSHESNLASMQSVKGKIELAKGAKDSPSAKRRGELIAKLKAIREKQGAGKGQRTQTFDKIKKLDESIKADINAQKNARGKVSFKSVEDLDRQIAQYEKQVDSGMMKLVDEKKAISEISNLRKQRKQFAGFDDSQKTIDKKKADLKALRDTLDDPESKALSEEYNTYQTELDAIKAEQDEAHKNIQSLYDERTKLYNAQQESWATLRKCKDDYYEQLRKVKDYEQTARKVAMQRRKQEQEKYAMEKKRERAQQVLSEASEKAYLDEIRRAETLLRFLDPSYSAEKAPLQAPSQFTAQAQRTVDDSGIKGVKVVRKEEEDYFAGTKGKKGKKNKKNAAKAESPAAPAPGKYNCPPAVMEDCSAMGIDPPMSAADIPGVREKVMAKLDHWKADQEAQTQKVCLELLT
ncbi:nuclear segregation protein [Tricladium varicosporioides]|nr:nuclear segregation protein [Hymenoscyphus varicosporioides]